MVCGPSGVGKSTLINLICRFYDVDRGALLIDGTDIRRVKLEDLRGQIGMVAQESFLFNGSIYENISYARPEASFEEVMRAAKAANAHEFITETRGQLPSHFHTDQKFVLTRGWQSSFSEVVKKPRQGQFPNRVDAHKQSGTGSLT